MDAEIKKRFGKFLGLMSQHFQTFFSTLYPSPPIGIVPFWATKNLKQVTIKAPRPTGYEKLLALCDGHVISNCARPCEFLKKRNLNLSDLFRFGDQG